MLCERQCGGAGMSQVADVPVGLPCVRHEGERQVQRGPGDGRGTRRRACAAARRRNHRGAGRGRRGA